MGTDAQLLGYSNHHIDMGIHEEGSTPWRLTSLYGESKRERRRDSLELVVKASNGFQFTLVHERRFE